MGAGLETQLLGRTRGDAGLRWRHPWRYPSRNLTSQPRPKASSNLRVLFAPREGWPCPVCHPIPWAPPCSPPPPRAGHGSPHKEGSGRAGTTASIPAASAGIRRRCPAGVPAGAAQPQFHRSQIVHSAEPCPPGKQLLPSQGSGEIGGCGAFGTITAHSSPNENVC